MQDPYGQSLSLLTDLYQLTMAYGYWRNGLAEREACFHLYAREAPFGGDSMVVAGVGPALDWLRRFRVTEDDCAYLATLRSADGGPLFPGEFLRWLVDQPFRCEIDAVEEGVAVFAETPILRVRGPLWQAQLVETPLLNLINFQTLIATKAARVCAAAGTDSVLEFGLRRAQGVDGGLAASRAAYIGGCSGTSNVLAGKLFGIPVRGTHAHSWVMAFGDEEQAFERYAFTLPDPCILLVDTFDTIKGVERAIGVGRALAAKGRKLAGIRLDSGDIAKLSREARAMLDAAGMHDTVIVGSNSLDEERIAGLKAAGAAVTVWGVGTRLVTSEGQAALGGVYKLSALRDEDGAWSPRIKLSDHPRKTSYPGVLQTWRYTNADGHVADVVVDESRGGGARTVRTFDEPGVSFILPDNASRVPLLVPMFRDGAQVYKAPPLDVTRARARENWKKCNALTIVRVGLEEGLHQAREGMIKDRGA